MIFSQVGTDWRNWLMNHGKKTRKKKVTQEIERHLKITLAFGIQCFRTLDVKPTKIGVKNRADRRSIASNDLRSSLHCARVMLELLCISWWQDSLAPLRMLPKKKSTIKATGYANDAHNCTGTMTQTKTKRASIAMNSRIAWHGFCQWQTIPVSCLMWLKNSWCHLLSSFLPFLYFHST